MPIFGFDDGSTNILQPGATASVSFTETSVNFVLSTTGNVGSSTLNYSPTVSNGQLSFTDGSAGGTYILDVNPTAAPLSNFGGSGGNITFTIGSYVSGNWNMIFVHETNPTLNQTFSIANGNSSQSFSFATGGNNYSAIHFIATSPGAFTLDNLTASIVCYLEGTGIETPKGRVAVEDLRAGDEIVTADGGTTTVRWIGEQPVDTSMVTPAKTFPICFKAGSIAPGVPARDLHVSPDHAMELSGVLINASALVNGRSITQAAQMPQTGFTYYHIDTGEHELILAEGAVSETYLDLVSRDVFINGDEMADAAPIAEMAKPRIVARRMVPGHVTAQLEERAAALGFAVAARRVA